MPRGKDKKTKQKLRIHKLKHYSSVYIFLFAIIILYDCISSLIRYLNCVLRSFMSTFKIDHLNKSLPVHPVYILDADT